MWKRFFFFLVICQFPPTSQLSYIKPIFCQSAAHAASQGRITLSKESIICPLLHTWACRCPILASTTVCAGEREYAIPSNFAPFARGLWMAVGSPGFKLMIDLIVRWTLFCCLFCTWDIMRRCQHCKLSCRRFIQKRFFCRWCSWTCLILVKVMNWIMQRSLRRNPSRQLDLMDMVNNSRYWNMTTPRIDYTV